ncbi:polyunsaturated fatty acid 5-lipoxygenase-like [Paramormyrops kingsleyae]|uniref:polyunsaturated fatty acid 5-lipoxygenase-like n=1 Tax=Paramormyrops kingsleyae TaxID=1676925 RepID=UPI003B96DC06
MEYTVRIEPDASADGIYIQLKNGEELSGEVRVTGQMTVVLSDFDKKPQEIIIQRKTSFCKRTFTTFYCKYIEVQSLESVFYFPVFKNISTTKETIAEGSGKLPWEDDEEKRREGLEEKKKLQELVGWTAPDGAGYKLQSGSAAHNSSSKNILSLLSLAKDDSTAIKETSGKLKTSLDVSHMSMAKTENQEELLLIGSPVSEQQSPVSRCSAKNEGLMSSEDARMAEGAGVKGPTIAHQYTPKEKVWNWISGAIHYRVLSGHNISKDIDKIYISGLPSFEKHGDFLKLQKDLWFGPHKLLVIIKNGIVVAIQTWLRKHNKFGRRWKKIDDIKSVFLFPSKKAKDISENWKDDAFFGSQFLNGCNPGMIQMCTEIPEKIPGISDVCPDISELIQKEKIYMVDYELLDNIKDDIIHGHRQYLAAPIVLLQETAQGLMPIAIQLKQKPGEENPIFTPKDAEAWLLAKIWVRNSDFYIHELVSHLLKTHLLAEIIIFSIFTSLHDHHPIRRIFAVTGRYTIPINIAARNTLTNKTGFFKEYTGFGVDAQCKVLDRAVKQLTYKSLCLPDNLKSRGVQKLDNYHYRDDGMQIWDAISEFLQKVVDTYYNDDSDIKKDEELQNFFRCIYHYGFEGQTDFPETVETKAEAVEYLSMVMFTCSAQHAAVNHGQYDTYAWMPNGPTTMRQPPPRNADEVDEDYIMNTLPDMETTLQGMSVARFLSQATEDFVALGTYADDVSNDPHLRDVIKNFQEKLHDIGEKIKERSKSQKFSYEYLYPSNIENSIAI